VRARAAGVQGDGGEDGAGEERKKEQAAQKKLREMGLCIQGFRWIKQASV
jgi:hypothetical protein